MDFFLFWFLKPIAEFFAGILFLVVIFIGILLYYTYQEWKHKRAKKKRPF